MTYRYEDYELQKGGSYYSYWELFRYAKDGDYFELVESPVLEFEGTRVVMKEIPNGGIVMKRAGTYEDDSSDTLVTPYGALTGGMWKRLVKKKKKVEITLAEALERINVDLPVKAVTPCGIEVSVSEYTDFSDLGVYDFDDLFDVKFYVEV